VETGGPSQGGGFNVPPGKTLNSSGQSFYDSLAQIESGGSNIYSKVDPDVSGPGTRSQGYDQINTPTWQQFGKLAGIDLSQYPNAISAPRDVQQQVAAQIPLSRFGPRTQQMLADQYGPLDKSKTIGELAGQYGGAGGGNNATMAYSGSPASAAASSPAAQSIASSIVGAFNPGAGARMAAAGPGMFPQLGAMLNQNAPVTAPGVPAGPGAGNVGPVTGFLPGASTGAGGIGSDVGAVANLPPATPATPAAAGGIGGIAAGAQKIADANQPQAGQGGGGQDPGAQQLAQMMAQGQQAQYMQQMRMNQFAQMAGQMRQGQGAGLHWGSSPPGAGIAGGMIGRPGMGTPTPGGGMVGGGTTLNSLEDLYGQA
jgi:hypothetical protein